MSGKGVLGCRILLGLRGRHSWPGLDLLSWQAVVGISAEVGNLLLLLLLLLRHCLSTHQAIEPNGREVALRRGCNVLMPILTPTKW